MKFYILKLNCIIILHYFYLDEPKVILLYFQIFRKVKEERDLSYYFRVQLKIISKKKKCNQRYIHKTNSTEKKIDQTERNDMKTYTH